MSMHKARVIHVVSNDKPLSRETSRILKHKLENNGFYIVDDFDPKADLIICVGGDGSFLNTLHSYNFPEINSNLINQFFRELNQIKNQYDFILLDFPSGLDSTILNMFSYSDFCLIVSTTEPISVMDAYAVSKLLKVNEIKAVKLVLINKAKDSAEGEQAFNNIQTAVQHFLKERLIFVGQTFSDSLVTESIINQSLYLKDFPNSQLAHQITSCVKELAKIKQVANSHQPIY